MAAPYNAIGSKAEESVQSVIRTAATGIADAQVFTSFQTGYTGVTSGADAEDLGTHSVSITFEGGIEDGFGSGNYRVAIRVQVLSNLDQSVEEEGGDEVATHRTYAGKVFDALCDTGLAASLTAAVSDFAVFNSIERTHGRQRVENRKAISEMLLEFSAAPSDIA